MSLIRKPVEAERASRLRRVAEATIDTAQDLKAGAHASGKVAQRSLARIGTIFLLGGFTFGALGAGSLGATLFALLLLCPFYYLAWRKWAA